jgi:hypothetical protein
MAITSSILSSTRQRIVLHLYATTAGDSSIINLVDLRRPEEIAFSTTSQLTVNIAAAYLNATDSTTSGWAVRRGTSSGTVVLDLHGASEYPGQNMMADLNQNNTSSIFINAQLPGMLVIDLRKVAGYAGPDTNVGV